MKALREQFAGELKRHQDEELKQHRSPHRVMDGVSGVVVVVGKAAPTGAALAVRLAAPPGPSGAVARAAAITATAMADQTLMTHRRSL
jgi:hypothetical protein